MCLENLTQKTTEIAPNGARGAQNGDRIHQKRRQNREKCDQPSKMALQGRMLKIDKFLRRRGIDFWVPKKIPWRAMGFLGRPFGARSAKKR